MSFLASPPQVLCLGEALVDRLGPLGGDPAIDSPWDDRLGGAPANVACALARLGTPAAFLGRLGRDGIGQAFAELFAERGVDTRALQWDGAHPSRIVLVRRDGEGERFFGGFAGDGGSGFADQAFDTTELATALGPLLATARWLLVGTIALASPFAASALGLACRQAGADAINIADSPMATARMSPLALAMLIRQQVDIEILLHVSCRDRNMLGLLSETMGAHALGIRHMLAVTGEPPSVGDYPGTHAVFELDSIGLLTLLERLNQGQNANGKELRFQTDFRLSCAVNPTAGDLDREIERFWSKQDAGAKYALTQPIFSLDVLERFVERV